MQPCERWVLRCLGSWLPRTPGHSVGREQGELAQTRARARAPAGDELQLMADLGISLQAKRVQRWHHVASV